MFGQVRVCVFMVMAVLPQCLAVSNHIYDMVRSLAESVCCVCGCVCDCHLNCVGL